MSRTHQYSALQIQMNQCWFCGCVIKTLISYIYFVHSLLQHVSCIAECWQKEQMAICTRQQYTTRVFYIMVNYSICA
jgi:hypothetical protein